MTEESDRVDFTATDLALMKALGIIDAQGRLTPEAYVGYVTRLRVNEQAQALGLPLIVLPPPSKKSSPEKKVADFFSKDKTLYVDGGFEESYMLRSFITSIAVGFNARKRKHKLSNSEIQAIADEVSALSEEEVIRRLEENNVVFQPHFGWAYSIRMPDAAPDVPYDAEKLVRRFRDSICYQLEAPSINDLEGNKQRCTQYIRSKTRAKQYADLMLSYLWLWRSLSPLKWADLVRVSLENWDKMATGWPDINIVSPDYGLILVEAKGKDKLHTSQVYTLLKLREVLGPERIAIAWTNRIVYDLPLCNFEHQDSVWRWIRTRPERRKNNLKHPGTFYSADKALLMPCV